MRPDRLHVLHYFMFFLFRLLETLTPIGVLSTWTHFERRPTPRPPLSRPRRHLRLGSLLNRRLGHRRGLRRCEIERAVDQREVRERLGEVAELALQPRIVLLG